MSTYLTPYEPGTRPPAAEDQRSEPVLAILLRERRLLTWIPALFALAGVIYMLATPTQYVSESRARPQQNQSAANRLAGLASQFGFAVPFGQNDPVRLYAEIAQSHELLKTVLLTRFTRDTTAGGKPELLLDMLRVRGRTPHDRIVNGVKKLRKITDIATTDASGTIRVRVRTPWPLVSEQVNRRMLELLDESSMRVRQQQASAERQFIAQRMEAAAAELRAAEAELSAFYSGNRAYEVSPRLSVAAGQYQRKVDLHQQVYTRLAESYEQSRIDEVRNTPVLGIIDPPEGTSRKVSRALDFAMWILAGLLFAGIAIMVQTALRRYAAKHPQEWQHLRQALGRAGRLVPSYEASSR